MTDKAFAYTNSAASQIVIAERGARHVTTRPYRPRTNGKAETPWQQQLERDRPLPEAEEAAELGGWNVVGLHHAEHQRVPQQVLEPWLDAGVGVFALPAGRGGLRDGSRRGIAPRIGGQRRSAVGQVMKRREYRPDGPHIWSP